MITNTVRRERRRRSSRRSERSSKKPQDFKSKYYDSADESSLSSADETTGCSGGCQGCKVGAAACGTTCGGKDSGSLIFGPKTSPYTPTSGKHENGLAGTVNGHPVNEAFHSVRLAVDSMQVALEALNTKLEKTHHAIDEVTVTAQNNSERVNKLLRKMHLTERKLDVLGKREKRRKHNNTRKQSPSPSSTRNSPEKRRPCSESVSTSKLHPADVLRPHDSQPVAKYEQTNDSKPSSKYKTNQNTQVHPKSQLTHYSNTNPKPNPTTSSRVSSKSPNVKTQTAPKCIYPKSNANPKPQPVAGSRGQLKPQPITRTRPSLIPNSQTMPKSRCNQNTRQCYKTSTASPISRIGRKSQSSKKSQPVSTCHPIQSSDNLTGTVTKWNSTRISSSNPSPKPHLVNMSTSTSVPSVLLASVCLSSENLNRSPRACRSAFVQTLSDFSDMSASLSSPFHSHPSILNGTYGRSNPGSITQAVERQLTPGPLLKEILSRPLCSSIKSSKEKMIPHQTDSSKILIHTVIIEGRSQEDLIPIESKEGQKSKQRPARTMSNPLYREPNVMKKKITQFQPDSRKCHANLEGCSQLAKFSMQAVDENLKSEPKVSQVVTGSSDFNCNVIKSKIMPSQDHSVKNIPTNSEGCPQPDAVSLQSPKKGLNSISTKIQSSPSNSDCKFTKKMLTQSLRVRKPTTVPDGYLHWNEISIPSIKDCMKSDPTISQLTSYSFNLDCNAVQKTITPSLPDLNKKPTVVLQNISHPDRIPTQNLEKCLKSDKKISQTESKSSHSDITLIQTTTKSCNSDSKNVKLSASSILIGTTNLEISFSPFPRISNPKTHETHSPLSTVHQEDASSTPHSDANHTQMVTNPSQPDHTGNQSGNNLIQTPKIPSPLNPFANAKEQNHQDCKSFSVAPQQEISPGPNMCNVFSPNPRSPDTRQDNFFSNFVSSGDPPTQAFPPGHISLENNLPNLDSRSVGHMNIFSVFPEYGSTPFMDQGFPSKNTGLQRVSPEYIPPMTSYKSDDSSNVNFPNPFLQSSPNVLPRESVNEGFFSSEGEYPNFDSRDGNPPSEYVPTTSDYHEQFISEYIKTLRNFVPQHPHLGQNFDSQDVFQTGIVSPERLAASRSLESQEHRVLGKELLKAAYEGRRVDVATLLSAGADVNFTWGSKWTPLHRAAWGGHADIIAILTSYGADVNARTVYGFTALHIAAYNDASGSCVKQLLSAGADVDARNQMGWTALHYAAESGRKDTVEVLMMAGANKELRSNRGKMPYHVARTQDIRKLLGPSTEYTLKNKHIFNPSV